ncbi:MAG: calcium-binding EGF-like domain-containing protein [Chitinophagales bacterium]|nr:calcium-binding EGF-like domain-containing protein [Chitinophagales bacterium]
MNFPIHQNLPRIGVIVMILVVFACSDKDNTLTTDACYGTSCLNGGTCLNGSCNCPQGYAGFHCETKLTPVSLTITGIEVSLFPLTDFSDNMWDASDRSNPDPYILLNPGPATVFSYYKSEVVNNAIAPLSYSNDLPYTLSNIDQGWSISVVDDDQSEGYQDQIMGGFYFTPISYDTDFPQTIELISSVQSLSITLAVIWNF